MDRPKRMPPRERLHEGLFPFCFGDCFTCSELGNDIGLSLIGGGGVAVCSEGGCGSGSLTTGVVRHACRHRVTARGVLFLWFGVGGFNPLRGADAGASIRRRHAAGATRPRPAAGQARINALFVFVVLWGALLPFVLRVVAGACVGRWTLRHACRLRGSGKRTRGG